MDKDYLRDYRYSSVFLIILGIAVVTMIFNIIFQRDSQIANYIGGFIGILGNYIISYSLINNRMGSASEYFANIKTINIKIIVINIILTLLFVLIEVLIGIGTLIGTPYLALSENNYFVIMFVIILINTIFYFFTAHMNYVLSDFRFRDLGVIKSIVMIFKISSKLIGKTFVLGLKFFGIYFVLGFLLFLGAANNIMGIVAITFPILGIALIILIFLVPAYLARLSDIYLDYIEENYPIDREIEEEL